MYNLGRSSFLVVAPVLIVVAIAGYLVGHGHPAVTAAQAIRESSNGVATVDYSAASGWRGAPSARPIPGLAIAHPLVVAPGGNSARSALIVGETAGKEGPLPETLLSGLNRSPPGQIIKLQNVEAYRFTSLTVPGVGIATVYVVPAASRTSVIAACYAARGATSELRTCESIAASLTLPPGISDAEAAGYLAPNARYAREVSSVIARLDALREKLQPGIRLGISNATAQGLTSGLAAGVASLVQSLAGIRPPAPAESAQAELLQSLRQLGSAYDALAASTSAKSAAGYGEARVKIAEAESALDAALRGFASLGYR